MKKRDLGNLKNKTVAELTTVAGDLSNQITRASMEMYLHKAKNVNLVKLLRKTLAQVLTIKREKELDSQLQSKSTARS